MRSSVVTKHFCLCHCNHSQREAVKQLISTNIYTHIFGTFK